MSLKSWCKVSTSAQINLLKMKGFWFRLGKS